jgi:hypothetical protein
LRALMDSFLAQARTNDGAVTVGGGR